MCHIQALCYQVFKVVCDILINLHLTWLTSLIEVRDIQIGSYYRCGYKWCYNGSTIQTVTANVLNQNHKRSAKEAAF